MHTFSFAMAISSYFIHQVIGTVAAATCLLCLYIPHDQQTDEGDGSAQHSSIFVTFFVRSTWFSLRTSPK